MQVKQVKRERRANSTNSRRASFSKHNRQSQTMMKVYLTKIDLESDMIDQ
jgi:hypothetical protein